MNTWQPIETAPKDGTVILALLPDNNVPYAVMWGDLCDSWVIEWDTWVIPKTQWPTYWMHCPEKP